MTAEVLFNEISGKYGVMGEITLNRPQALNALNLAMITAIDQQLAAWEKNQAIKAVLMRSVPGRAFCAGGDIRSVYANHLAGHEQANLQLFWQEYQLNRRIFHYPKPYIALLTGLTMGGGVGISIPGSHRIATPELVLAMPETAIGFFPDVGSSYILPRCRGKFGFYLGLTGARLNAYEAHYVGLVDYVIPAEQIAEALASVLAIDYRSSHASAHTLVAAALQAQAAQGQARAQALAQAGPLAQQQKVIDRCFAQPTVPALIQALEQENSEFTDKMVAELNRQSPTSLVVTLQQLHYGAKLSFDEGMQMEYRLVNRFLQGHDFYEGIRAAVIDKDRNPRWQPDHLAAVATAEIAHYFSPLAVGELAFS